MLWFCLNPWNDRSDIFWPDGILHGPLRKKTRELRRWKPCWTQPLGSMACLLEVVGPLCCIACDAWASSGIDSQVVASFHRLHGGIDIGGKLHKFLVTELRGDWVFQKVTCRYTFWFVFRPWRNSNKFPWFGLFRPLIWLVHVHIIWRLGLASRTLTIARWFVTNAVLINVRTWDHLQNLPNFHGTTLILSWGNVSNLEPKEPFCIKHILMAYFVGTQKWQQIYWPVLIMSNI